MSDGSWESRWTGDTPAGNLAWDAVIARQNHPQTVANGGVLIFVVRRTGSTRYLTSTDSLPGRMGSILILRGDKRPPKNIVTFFLPVV